MPAQEGPVLVGAHAFTTTPWISSPVSDDARMRGEHLDVRDAGYAVQGGEEVLGMDTRCVSLGSVCAMAAICRWAPVPVTFDRSPVESPY